MAAIHSDTSLVRPMQRWMLIGMVTLISAALCWLWLSAFPQAARDFSWPLHAARLLLAGINPYTDPNFGQFMPFDYDAPLYYPLPTVLVALPFTPLPDALAGTLFFGTSTAVLGYALTRRQLWPLLICGSAPFVAALFAVQWSPLVVATALIPQLFVLTVVKPNLGIPIAVTRLTWQGAAACAAALLLSLIILPSWPRDWLINLGANRHTAALFVLPWGPLLLLALLAWRQPDAWLLLLLALLPQKLSLYDQLPLLLLARTRPQLLFSLLSAWIASAIWMGDLQQPLVNMPPKLLSIPADLTLACTYLPALVLLLWNNRRSPPAKTVDTPPVA